jgi:hypothetical protein
MHKKPIVLLCLFLTLLFVFAACNRHSRYGTIIVDQQGMEHVVMTDANGVTVIDSDGNLIEIVTDSGNKKPIALPTQDGTAAAGRDVEYQTHPVTFPGVVENDSVVEDAICRLTLPEGWEQTGNSILLLQNTQTGAQIQISTDIGGTATGAIETLVSQIESLSPEGGYTQTDVMIDGVLATRTQYELGDMTVISYLLVTDNGKVCRVNCTVDTDKYDSADVDAVVQEIHFK